MLNIRFVILLFASGLSKGYAYLMAPIIFSQFGAALLGEYVLITTICLLLSQVISLNPTAVIIRNSDKNELCIEYTFLYYLLSLATLFISCSIYLLLYLLGYDTYYTLFFILASAEALFLVIVAFFRANDMYIRFVLIVLFKSVLIGSYLFFSESDINSIILFAAIVAFFLSIIFIIDKFWSEKSMLTVSLCNFKLSSYTDDLLFGVKLIPHSLGLWGFSSATKVILKIIVGSVALGLFTVYFTFAFPIVLINSALTLYLPREIVRSPSSFVGKRKDVALYKGYTSFVLFIILLIMLFCYFDNTHSLYIQTYSYISIVSIVLSCLTFYNFGTYQFLSNYLFYTKDSNTLSRNTIVSAISAIFLSIILSYAYGVLGATLALYLSSMFYVYVTFKSAKNLTVENNTTLIWNKFCFLSPTLLVVCLSLGYIVI